VARSRIGDHGIWKILEQRSIADGKSRMLFGVLGARAMTVQARGSRGRDLRGRAGLNFYLQRQAVSRQHASRDVV
jgi:hypothetical protein